MSVWKEFPTTSIDRIDVNTFEWDQILKEHKNSIKIMYIIEYNLSQSKQPRINRHVLYAYYIA
jgi:hypothetical protein